ncbi:MAG: diphosphomevalonate decarboxylase [Patescibacteria group bacterium]|nr:diphosphomevalonate decarboxylase [Patescibacteria group bacterium]
MIKKIKVKSPANIAFIKYWGQKDNQLIIPYNDSFSMNLSACLTYLEGEILENKEIKEVFIKDYKKENFLKANTEILNKIISFYSTAKKFLNSKKDFGFRIYSKNTFPKKSGIAGSASFFSALALFFATAFEKKLNQKQLSILARLSGSGSACRSIPDGFSWWRKGNNNETSYAYSLAPPNFWDLRDLVLIVNPQEKKVGSYEGHQQATTSFFFKFRLKELKKRLIMIKKAFFKKDFSLFGQLLEEDALSMHIVMMTQRPPLYYWSEKTFSLIKKIVELRKSGKMEGYYTIDAGENIHLICQKNDYQQFIDYFKEQPEILKIIDNQPSTGAKIIEII